MRWFCVGLLLSVLGLAADPVERPPTSSKRVWIRRLTLGAACAASLTFDAISTRRAISAGAIETNPMMGGGHWGPMMGVKAGVCAVSFFAEERSHSRQADWTATGVNLGTTVGYTWAGFHNLKVANDLVKQQ